MSNTWVHIATSKNEMKLWKVFAENSMPFRFAAWTIRYIKNKRKDYLYLLKAIIF
jgi:hypothetical protein